MSITAIATLSKREIASIQHYGDWMNDRIVKALAARFYHRNHDGSMFTPRIQEAVSFPPYYHVVVLDSEALWHFPKDRLIGQDALNALTGAVQRPVRIITTIPAGDGKPTRHGIAYVVTLRDIPAEQDVPLPKLVTLDLAQLPKHELLVGFGMTSRSPMWSTLPRLTHIIVAGSSDSGKSAFLRSLVYQLAHQELPIDLYLADMEGLTFAWAENWPILKAPIAQDLKAATDLTGKLLSEIDRRGKLYRETGRYPESWQEYKDLSGNTLPWIVAIFDEFAALVDEAGKSSQFVQNISQLAMRARKFGVTLVFAGQDFKADLLNTRITNQLKTRVQFRAARREQCEVVLGQGGAEKITVPGRALIRLDGDVIACQTFWVPKSEVVTATAQPMRPTLTDQERGLATWAIQDNGGYLSIADIRQRGGFGKNDADRLAQKWERDGWLEKDAKARNKRRVTSLLAGLVGLETGKLENSGNSGNSGN